MSQQKRNAPLAMAMLYGAYPEWAKDQEIARLKAENERLLAYTKELECIGNDLAGMVGHTDVTGDAHRQMLILYDDWNKVVEGRDAK